jgi:cardiolipin synthase
MVLDSRPGRGQKELASILASVVAAARERLWITVAYFAPRHRALSILGSAARRGVDVRLLLPGKSDIPIVRHAGHALYSGLLRRGVRVFEYDAAILHAKSLVADGYLSIVGSSNLDFRSLEFNAECNFLILDEPTAKCMEATFENDLGHAREIQPGPWRKRGRIHRSLDRLARTLSPIL